MRIRAGHEFEEIAADNTVIEQFWRGILAGEPIPARCPDRTNGAVRQNHVADSIKSIQVNGG
jgi:hypothetical protein